MTEPQELSPIEKLEQGPRHWRKWAVFSREFIKDRNIERAGARSGYSYGSARHVARRQEVIDAIAFLTEEAARAAEITAERVIEELGIAAFMDIKDLFDENGCLLQVHELPYRASKAISAIEVQTIYDNKDVPAKSTITKIRFVDKLGALNTLARHFNLFEKEHKSTADSLAELLKEISGQTMGLPNDAPELPAEAYGRGV